MTDADVAGTEDERCGPDENDDPNVVLPVATPVGHVDKRRRAVRSKKTRPRVAEPAPTHPAADRSGEYLDVQLERRQLPIRVAFAMTINKAQGLTLRRVGVHVEEDVFSHGQLYVAFSRCGDPDNLCVFGPKPDKDNAVWIKNVVYREVLIDDM